MRNPFHGFLEIFKDENHVWSSARFCAVFLLPCVYIAVFKQCDAGVVGALVVGGIGALTVRNISGAVGVRKAANVHVEPAASGPTVVVNSTEGSEDHGG